MYPWKEAYKFITNSLVTPLLMQLEGMCVTLGSSGSGVGIGVLIAGSGRYFAIRSDLLRIADLGSNLGTRSEDLQLQDHNNSLGLSCNSVADVFLYLELDGIS